MGQRDARIGRRRQRSRDTRHNLKIDSVRGQTPGFLPAPSENEGISSFEADHGFAGTPVPDKNILDLVLGHGVKTRLLADKYLLATGPTPFEQTRMDEIIVDQDIRLRDQ